jgi:hypothetical protein
MRAFFMSMDGQTDICSSAIAPALPYYRPSMDICNLCTSTIHGGRRKIAPCIFRTPHVLVGRIPQGAMDGGAVMSLIRDKHQ